MLTALNDGLFIVVSTLPEMDQFQLGWPKSQFPDVYSGTKSRSRSFLLFFLEKAHTILLILLTN